MASICIEDGRCFGLRLRPEPHAPDMIEFCAWVAQAEAGESFIYYFGHLGHDRLKVAKVHPLEIRRQIGALAGQAMTLAEAGFVHLVQMRLGVGKWAYIAIRSKKALSAERSRALLEEFQGDVREDTG